MNTTKRHANTNLVGFDAHSCALNTNDMKNERNEILLITRLLLFPVLLLMATMSMASVLDDVKATLSDRLPKIDDAVPGYSLPDAEPVSIAIGDFYTDSDDGIDWGYVVADVMRSDLTGHIDMPSRNVRMDDAWTMGMDRHDQMRSDDSLALYYKRYGTKKYVSGRISVKDGRFIWNAYIRSLPENNTLQKISATGELRELPGALQEVIDAVVSNVAVDIKVSMKKYDIEMLRAYGNLLNEINGVENTVAFNRISDAMERHHGFVPMVLLYAEYYPVPYGYDDIARQQNLFSRLADEYPKSAAVQLCLTRHMMPSSGKYSVADEKIRRLKKYVSQFPQDSMGLVYLINGLVSEERQLQGIALALEALRQWPDNFRLWWDLNYALDSYAWRLRGDKFWNDVPPEGKRLFPVLLGFALKTVDEAVGRNTDNAIIWRQRMRAIATYNDEFKDSFMHAIAIAPGYRDAYETAMEYASPKWGGTIELQYDVLKLARANNPGERWPDALEYRYIDEEDRGGSNPIERLFSDVWEWIKGIYAGK